MKSEETKTEGTPLMLRLIEDNAQLYRDNPHFRPNSLVMHPIRVAQLAHELAEKFHHVTKSGRPGVTDGYAEISVPSGRVEVVPDFGMCPTRWCWIDTSQRR